MKSDGLVFRAVIVTALAVGVGCTPGEDSPEVEPGAIPAAPDMRPGTEGAPGGVVPPGAVTDTLPGDPRTPLPDPGEGVTTDTV